MIFQKLNMKVKYLNSILLYQDSEIQETNYEQSNTIRFNYLYISLLYRKYQARVIEPSSN